MTLLINSFTVVTTLLGLFFFIAGTVGLLRFPDVHSRLHALTKADNLGLGLIILGVLPFVATYYDGIQLLLIWLLMLCASAVASFLVASFASKTHDAEKRQDDGETHEH